MAYISMLFGFLALIYGFAIIIEKEPRWLINLTIFTITIVVSIIILLLIMKVQRERQKSRLGVFVSYPEGQEKAVDMLKEKLASEHVIEGERVIRPGDNIEKEVKRYVSKSSVCFVLISNKISRQQKIEIREITRQKKRVIPLLLSSDVKMPASLKNTKSALLSEYCRIESN